MERRTVGAKDGCGEATAKATYRLPYITNKAILVSLIAAWDKPIFDGFASRTDVSGLDPVFTATLLGVMGTLNKAYVSKTPREWAYTSSEMKTSLAFTGAVTEAKFESFMEYANGLFFQDVDEMRSCSHIGCGLRGIDAQALKAVNTFKMDIKAATNMRADNLWENSTNAKYLNLAASQGYGVIADIDNWDQTERDNIIANYTTINHHGFAWHTGTNSGTAPHDGQCSGTVTISSDGSFSDGHLTGLSYHDYADCTWVLDSGTASGEAEQGAKQRARSDELTSSTLASKAVSAGTSVRDARPH